MKSMNSRSFRRWEAKPKHSSRRNTFLSELFEEVQRFQHMKDCEIEIAAFFDPHAVKFFFEHIKNHGIVFDVAACLMKNPEHVAVIMDNPGMTKVLLSKFRNSCPDALIMILLSMLSVSQDELLCDPRNESLWMRLLLLKRNNDTLDEGICLRLMVLLTKCGIHKLKVGHIVARLADFEVSSVEYSFLESLTNEHRDIYLAKRMDFGLMNRFPDSVFVKNLREILGCWRCGKVCNSECPRYKVMICSRHCHKKLWRNRSAVNAIKKNEVDFSKVKFSLQEGVAGINDMEAKN